jgi:hypothetical protein
MERRALLREKTFYAIAKRFMFMIEESARDHSITSKKMGSGDERLYATLGRLTLLLPPRSG